MNMFADKGDVPRGNPLVSCAPENASSFSVGLRGTSLSKHTEVARSLTMTEPLFCGEIRDRAVVEETFK